MTIALFLIPFFLFLLFFVLMTVSALYHIVRFELLNIVTIVMTIIFGAGTFFIATVSASYMADIDWSEPIALNIFENISTQPTTESDETSVLTF